MARAAVLSEERPELGSMPDLEAAAERLTREAEAALPPVDAEALLRHAASLLPSDGTAAETLRILRGGDLWLALACARKMPGALAEFERKYAREIPGALSRIRATADMVDEVGQMVREKLFVADPPKILGYSGRGPLVSWLRAVIVHTAVSLQRRDGRSPAAAPDEALADVPASANDPELRHLRARFAEPFRAAFLEALRELDAKQRTVLRLNVIDQLNIEQIGVVYRVHRATVARWIASTREQLVQRTRTLLCERLGIEPSEVASIERLCMSQIDLSLRSALVEPA